MNTPRSSKATSATPKVGKRNPFDESPVLSRLTGNIVTPGIFQQGTSRFNDTKGAKKGRGRASKVESASAAPSSSFWSIEHMAAILPVEFHEKELLQEQAPPDPEYEAKAHAAIESFWSRNVIYVPSPEALATRLGTKVRMDRERMKRLSLHKGLRHYSRSLKVRGQHAKTIGRKGHTAGGVMKKGGG